jgi:polysaccharide biosynthesis/export protein
MDSSQTTDHSANPLREFVAPCDRRFARPALRTTIFAIVGCLTTIGGTLGLGQVVPASSYHPGTVAETMGNRYPHHAGGGHVPACGCEVCRASHPAPARVCPPDQSTGVSSGACQPCFRGIDCADSGGLEQRWRDVSPMAWEPLRHGEYVGPVRLPAMLDYRARVGDEFQFIFVRTREKTGEDYRMMVGDEIMIASVTDADLRQGDLLNGLRILDDGNVVLRLVGPIPAAGKTLEQLRKDIEKAYSKYLNNPSIDVTPVKTNTALEDLRQAVSNIIGNNGGQNISGFVNPDGQIQLPLIGSVYVVGMTIEEIKREVNLRYRERLTGIEIEPRLIRQAQHFVYVFGQVTRPGRYEITQPTTVTQALALAEGPRIGANTRQVVVFRRAEDWRLVSTMLDLRGAHLGKRPNPSDEIWLRDNDLIIVPPRPIQVFNDFVRQVFTDGLYPMVPGFLSVSSTGDVSIQGGGGFVGNN